MELRRMLLLFLVFFIGIISCKNGTEPEDTTVVFKPKITIEPQPVTVDIGQTASFHVEADGTAPFTYQWQKNDGDISVATDSMYTTPATVKSDSGSTFRCIVSNSGGSDTSTSALLKAITVVIPQITSDPKSAVVDPGQSVTFSVIAAGTSPMTYQWQKIDADISGATAISYTTPAAVADDSGSTFRCIVSNRGGSDTSSRAQLSVNKNTILLQNGINNYSGCKDSYIFYKGDDSTKQITNYSTETILKTTNCPS